MINKVIKEEEADRVPLVPPGFESLISFTLRRIRDNSVTMDCVAGSSNSSLTIGNNEHCIIGSDSSKMARILRRKPWVNYNEFEDRSDIEINSKGHEDVPSKWHPAEARRPSISDAPAFYPTEEEFKDTLKYIASIRCRAEPYGICRIVPPPSWKPSCPLKEKHIWENSKFPTRVQRIDKLQNRISSRKSFNNQQKMLRQRRRPKMTMEGDSAVLYAANDSEYRNRSPTEGFGFEPGLEFTLASFEKYAIDFKEQYFCTEEFSQAAAPGSFHCQKQREPSIEDIEGEYWRIVENTSQKIEVLYGADIETQAFGSGFPKSTALESGNYCANEYAKCGWNLNNISRLPGSMLSYESGDISGVLVPWLYVGMCFSSFCWHVEDHHLYSLNYMHWGAPKIWYGVAGKNALMLEEAMKKHLHDLFDEQPDLLHKLVTQLSPTILKSEGVPVYRCVQNPGEFVLTFPRAYHSGFNCGFNCAEAVNVAPIDWLPHGQNAVECYREQGRKISVSHDKLLLGGASEAVKALYELLFLNKSTPENLRWKGVCGKDGILSKALKARVEMEQERRESLCNSLRTRKMEKNFDADTEKECAVCCYDLHLSAAGCDCSSDRFACLMHVESLCACDWNSRYFIFRYEVSDLLVLLEALEGKLSAVHKWAKSDLGLSLSSFVGKQGTSYLSTCSAAVGRNNSAMATSVSRKNDHKVVGGTFANGNEYVTTVSSYLDKESHVAESKLGCCSSNEKMLVHTGDLNGHFQDLQKLNAGTEYLVPKEVRHVDSNVARFSTSQGFQKNQPNMDQFSCNPNANGHTLVEKTRPPFSRSSVTHEMSSSSSTNGSHNVLDRINRHSSISEVSHMSTSFAQKDTNTASNISCKTPDSLENNASVVKRKINEIVPNVPVHVEKKICVVKHHSVKGKQNGFLGPSNKHPSISEVARISTGLAQNDINNASCKTPDSSENTASGVKRKMNEIVPDVEAHLEKKNCVVNPHLVKGKEDGFLASSNSHLQITPDCPSEHLSRGAKNENSEGNFGSGSDEKLAPGNGNLSQSQNSLHRLNRHKGPRIAKVVRRVNCEAELLDVGAVMPGKLWSNEQAIFLNGFRSRVKYYSIFDPTKMCYYVSEVLESSQLGPLFKVTLEECSTEVFIHLTAVKCWDMVRERVNMEIRKQHALGKVGLPPLQPPTSVDGLEMFGFSSSTVIKAFEAKDPDHLCVEYWSSKADNKQQVPTLTGFSTLGSKPNAKLCTTKELHEYKATPDEVDKVLKGLLRKADTAELVALRSLLTIKKENHSFDIVTRLIAEEFLTRSYVNSNNNIS